MTRARGRFTHWVFIAACTVALVIVLAGPLVRFDLVAFRTMFGILSNATIAAGVIALIALVAIIIDWRAKRGVLKALLAFAIAGVPFLFMMSLASGAQSVPAIHDITTDTDDPPAFVAVLPLRADAPNPPDYDPEVGAQQIDGYPDLQSLSLPVAPPEAFARAEAALDAEGLEIIASEPEEGRLEATATTAWFGFKDDVVIRVRSAGETSSVVDIRSKSRMGMSDLGANAARIEALLARIEG
ncbi:MAG: DUF1499 domain-containing protein [Pacificimonas sp.]